MDYHVIPTSSNWPLLDMVSVIHAMGAIYVCLIVALVAFTTLRR